MSNISSVLTLDKDEMTEVEKRLFLKDLKRVLEEYFELGGEVSLDLTRDEGGFLACVLFPARRIKTVKSPI